jgi:hypothetical protein
MLAIRCGCFVFSTGTPSGTIDPAPTNSGSVSIGAATVIVCPPWMRSVVQGPKDRRVRWDPRDPRGSPVLRALRENAVLKVLKEYKDLPDLQERMRRSWRALHCSNRWQDRVMCLHRHHLVRP